MAHYLDTSAFVKLVVAESHSDSLIEWIRTHQPTLVASDLMAVEAVRVARRHSSAAVAAARERLDRIVLLRLTPAICERASDLDPVITRSLDALHIATALELGSQLRGVVTYDSRMAQAAQQRGLVVVAPGVTD